ncbi:MAG: hypothetical protein ABTD50_04850 [Polyangiaceae bacterium]|jgi:hypothetical protein
MEPYVCRYNDYLAKIADKFGFDADAVWNDPANDKLRKLRRNPSILLAGDVLYIPDQVDKTPTFHVLTVGVTNSFTSPDPAKVPFSVRLVGDDDSAYVSKSFVIQELEQLQGLQTDSDGVARFEVPVTMERITLEFGDSGETVELAIGALNPIGSRSGLAQRLQNLGCMDGKPAENVADDDLHAGLACMVAMQARSSDAPSADDSGDSEDDDSDWMKCEDLPIADGNGAADDADPIHPKLRELLVVAHGC